MIEALDPRLASLPELTRDIYDKVDAAVAKSTEQMSISCKRGCSACCNHLIISTLAEAVTVADWIRGNRRKDLWKLAGDADSQRDFQALLDRDIKNITDYYDQDIPCRFLAKDGICSIYPVRPLACRLHVAISPKEQCLSRKKGGGSVTAVTIRSRENKPLSDLVGSIFDGIVFQLGLPIISGWFPVVLFYVVHNISAIPGAPGIYYEPMIGDDQLSVLKMVEEGNKYMGVGSGESHPGRYELSQLDKIVLDKAMGGERKGDGQAQGAD